MGGAAAEIYGGNFGQGFSQGATMAAIGHLANDMLHPNPYTEYPYDVNEVDAEIFERFSGDISVSGTLGGVTISKWADGESAAVASSYAGASVDYYYGYGRVGASNSIHELTFGLSKHLGIGAYYASGGKFGLAFHVGIGKPMIPYINYSGPQLPYNALDFVGP